MMSEKHDLEHEVKEKLGLEGEQPFYEGGHDNHGLGPRKFRLYGVGRHRNQHQTDSFNLYGDEPNPLRRYAPMAAAVLAGGLVIAGAMMLLGPASNRKKIQHRTREFAKDAVDSVGKAAGDVMDKAGDVASAARKVGKKALRR